MAKDTEIKREFMDKTARKLGGLLIFSPGVAIDLIERCRMEKLKVLGLDGFFLHEGGGVQPSMEHSLDLSNVESSRTHDLAFEFIRAREGKGLHFEVVVASDT